MRIILVAVALITACGDDQGAMDLAMNDLTAAHDQSVAHDLATPVDFSVPDLSLADFAEPPDDGPKPDMAMLPALTVNNTESWCDITVVINSVSTTFGNPFDAAKTFHAAAGTTVSLSATPHSTFLPVVWTNVTTNSGMTATYVMTGAATQSVTGCCAFSNGTGC